MAKSFHVVIVGGGPAGLSTALALAKEADSNLQVTVLELRDGVQTLGGAVNLTPLAMRYIDCLGAGPKLRPQASTVQAIELIAHRTGSLLGRLWPDVDAIRVERQLLVESLRDTILQTASHKVNIAYNAKITTLDQREDGISVTYRREGTSRTIDADVLIGCDGIHSQVRSSLIDPDRHKTYSGKSNTYGYADLRNVSEAKIKEWTRSDGAPLVTDTTLVSKGGEALLVTYYEPSHQRLYLAYVKPMAEKENAREGWAAHGSDKARLKTELKEAFAGGGLPYLPDIIDLCDDWFFFPVYMLPPEGTWFMGRAIVIGDAAHAVSRSCEASDITANLLIRCLL